MQVAIYNDIYQELRYHSFMYDNSYLNHKKRIFGDNMKENLINVL